MALIGWPSVCRPSECAMRNTTPMAALVSGPTTVIRNSSAGPFASTFAWVAPPNRNSVMPLTGIPRTFDMPAWASSCPRTEPKKSAAVRTARAPAAPLPRSGNCDRSEKKSQKLNVNSTAMMPQDGSTRISTPPIRPIFHPPVSMLERYPRPRPSATDVDPFAMGVDVEASVSDESGQRHPELLRRLHREVRRRRDRAQDRDAGHRGLLDDLEADPTRDQEDAVRQWEVACQEALADQLVDRVVPPDVLPNAEQVPLGIEQAARVEAAGLFEDPLRPAELLGERQHRGTGDHG